MTRLTSPSTGDILTVLQRLTDRDHQLISVLGRHKALTIEQVARLAFGSIQAARTRVNVLVGLDVLARFRQCVRPGSQAYRYTLGHTGAYIHAAATSQPIPTPASINRRITELAASSHLNHLLGVNDIMTRIHTALRHRNDLSIVEWLNEAQAGELTGSTLRPDAAFTLRRTDSHGEHETGFWLEHDTGTETTTRLITKTHRYASLPGGGNRTLLFHLPNPGREAHLHAALTGNTNLKIATTTHVVAEPDPTAAIWFRLGGSDRKRLERL